MGVLGVVQKETSVAKRKGQISEESGTTQQHVSIPAPNLRVAEFVIEGASPYVQHKFSEKTRAQMVKKHEEGLRAKKGKGAKTPRNFEEDYKNATYRSTQGKCGIPAAALRNAMISACRLVDFKMTIAKLSLFVLADGYDETTALVYFVEGKPEPTGPMEVRNADGSVDLRNRPVWHEWRAKVRIQYDADHFSTADVANLLARAGQQVGIGEGRPGSKNSSGMGWGLFRIVNGDK